LAGEWARSGGQAGKTAGFVGLKSRPNNEATMEAAITMKTILAFPVLFSAVALAQAAGTFTPTGSMNTARSQHTATLLANGKVLITGGFASGNPGNSLASAEVYDPSTGAFTPTGDMITGHRLHRATLLADGRVLITGGIVAELYDPVKGTFTPGGTMARAQNWHTATQLANGNVLVAGAGSSAELYDFETGTFTATGPYTNPGGFIVATAALLPDGRVLITGCADGCNTGLSQLYDPGANTFSATGPMKGWYNINTATLLTNGEALVVGSDEYPEPADAEIFEPSTGTYTSIGNTAAPHEYSTATLLPDGTVAIAGGQMPGGSGDPTVELYDVTSGKFAAGGSMRSGRHSHTATLLPDGAILFAGGNIAWPFAAATAEIYRPPVSRSGFALLSLSGGQGAILHAGTSRVVSAADPAVSGEVLEIYCTGLIDGSVIPPQVAIGGRMAEVLWFGNTPGFLGLNQINVRVSGGVAPGPAVPVRVNYISLPSNEVTIGVQ
jgi:uncharacterized protein (TIGR03437 family)